MFNGLVNIVANDRSDGRLQTPLLCQHLCMTLRQVLPVLNRDRWSKCHGLLIVAESELDLTVLTELSRTQEVVCSLSKSVFLLGVDGVDHSHSLRILKFYGLGSRNFGKLCDMDHFILRNICNLLAFTSDLLECVIEFLLAILHREEFIESKHLIKFIGELVALGPRDEFVGALAAQLEGSFSRKRVLGCIDHLHLVLIKRL